MRLSKTRHAWHKFGPVWTTGQITLRLRFLLYTFVVLPVLISGLEALVLSPSDFQTLEKFHMGCIRKLMRGLAFQRTNVWVRTFLSSPTIDSVLCAKRFAFLQSMLRDPCHHVLPLAAITGWRSDGKDKPYGNNELPSEHATPMFRQWWRDIARLAQHVPTLQLLLPQSWRAVATSQAFLDAKPRLVLSFLSPLSSSLSCSSRPPPSPSPPPSSSSPSQLVPSTASAHIQQYVCTQMVDRSSCARQFQFPHALQVHQFRMHGVQSEWRRACITNQCPISQRVFADIKLARTPWSIQNGIHLPPGSMPAL